MSVKKKILIVGQEKILSDLLADVFPPDSFEILASASADEGRQLADQNVFDLAIVDPSIAWGFQLIDFLRSKGATKVLALSSDQEALSQAVARGIDPVIDKNAGLESLVRAIRLSGFNCELPGKDHYRILVVDDTTDTREMLVCGLMQRGYDVCSAASGKEALETLKREPSIALVVLDVIMPEVGGVEVLKEMRARYPDLPVVMCSAIHDREIAQRSLQLGAFDYTLKPIDFDVMDSVILAALTRAELKRQPWWQRLTA